MPGLLLLWPAKALSPAQRTTGGAHATAALTSQAIRGLVAAGASEAAGAMLLAAIRALAATAVAEALGAAGLTARQIAFTRGLCAVRSGDAVMPGVAVPDPRWGNSGGPAR